MNNINEMNENDADSLDEILLAEEAKSASSDTQTFRIALFKQLIHVKKQVETVKQQVSNMTCVANPKTVEAHEKLIGDLSEKHNKLDTSLQLLVQAVNNGNKTVLDAVAELKTGRDTNAINIGKLEKTIGTVNGKVEEGKTIVRTSLWWISIFWVLSIAGLSALIFFHDRIPHSKDIETAKPVIEQRNNMELADAKKIDK